MHEENICAEYVASLWTLQITGPVVLQKCHRKVSCPSTMDLQAPSYVRYG
jgi:hypothetical protein